MPDAPPPDLKLRERGSQELRCPYCHDALGEEDPGLVRCGACEAGHHAACAVEGDACAACGESLDASAIPRDEDTPCAFKHECENQAIVGDYLCPDHRRRVSLGRQNLQGSLDEALELIATLERVATVASVFSGPLVFVFIRLGYRLLTGDRPGFLLTLGLSIAVAGAFSALASYLKTKTARIRPLLESIPEHVIDPGARSVRASERTQAGVKEAKEPT